MGLARNTTLNLVGQGLPLVVALLSMPLVVGALGATRFGILALGWTVVGYMAMVDLGFGRATIQRISALAWSGEAAAVRRVAGTAALTQAALGLAGGVVLWLTAPALAGLLTAGDAAARGEATGVLAVLAWGVPGVLLSNAHRAALEGMHRFDLVNAVRGPVSAAMYLVPVAGVLAGWSLVGIVAGLVVARWAGAAAFALLARRCLPPGPAGFDGGEFRRLLSFGAWVALSNAIIPAVVYLERFVVSGRLGVDQLGYYAAPHEMVMRLLLVPGAVGAVLFPAFSGLAARGARDEILAALRSGWRITAVLLLPLLVVLIAFAGPLLNLWLGAEFSAAGAPVVRILALALFLNALAFLPFTLLEGSGRPDLVAKYHVLELPVYAAVLWFLVGRFGIAGAALGWLLRTAWMLPVLHLLAARQAGLGGRAPLAEGVGRALAVTAALLLLAQVVAVLPPGVMGLTAGVVLLAVSVVVGWLWVLGATERATLLRTAARLRGQAPG